MSANSSTTLDAEEHAYHADVVAVKKWWSDSRWRYTKRPFTAEQIVAKRGNLKIDYPSNVQSKKLWGILEERFRVREKSIGVHGRWNGTADAVYRMAMRRRLMAAWTR